MSTKQPIAAWINEDLGNIDLGFQGLSRVIAAWVLRTEDGIAIIEPGPGSTVAQLRHGLELLGLSMADVRHILATHIHLDHAGASGALLEELPNATLYVHRVGAPHMADPSNLLRSAERIYGAMMEPLWGRIMPVPPERMTVLDDGDVLQLGGRKLTVLYTPGHASHHVAFLDDRYGDIFAGDVAGIRIPPNERVLPPTPPPDIDIAAWHGSIARLREAKAERLMLTHFGVVERERVAGHLDELDRRLDTWVNHVQALQSAGTARAEIVADLKRKTEAELGVMEPSDTKDIHLRYATACQYGMSVDGIARYLRQRERAASG